MSRFAMVFSVTSLGPALAPEGGNPCWAAPVDAHETAQELVRLPCPVDASRGQARLGDGLLTVVLPEAGRER